MGVFRIGEKGNPVKIFQNGTKLELEAATRIASDSMLVPLRFVSEALGAMVQWDGIDRVVRISS